MQTEGKAIEMFAQPFDRPLDHLINQYANVDSSNGDGNKEVSVSGDCGDFSPIGSSTRHHPQSPQPWSKGLWYLQQDAASSAEQQSAFHETILPSAVSDLSLDLGASSRPGEARALLSSSPSTPPATPSRKASTSKGAILTPTSVRHPEPNDCCAFLRKHTFSPSLMRSSHPPKGKMAYLEAWAQRFQNFNNLRGSEEHLPLSPPLSDILVQHENIRHDNTAQMNVSTSGPSTDGVLRNSTEMPTHYDSNMFHHQSPSVSMPSPSANALARPRYLGYPNYAALTTSSPASPDDIFHCPHSSKSQPMPSWNTDTLGTPALPFTPDLHSHDSQSWWSLMPSRVPQYQSMVSPVPQRPIQSINQNDLLQGGLMIQLGPSFDMSSAAGSSFSSSGMPPVTTHEHRPCPNIPAAQQRFSNDSPFATSLSSNSSDPSRSPSVSPTNTTSPKSGVAARNAANMRINQRRSHRLKLSLQPSSGPKPVKAPGGSSGSPKGANKTVCVSFVNFTPEDSHKILTGVAPSGSSKTKARREQEARERRRKLSEAAIMAVRKAGGDVEALEAVLC
ncbi:developmental regulatory protein weta [Thermoascus aurantiacus ATCC 26904]